VRDYSMALKDYPEWVIKHKTKGTELRCINGKYYLYQVHSQKVDGKFKKITDKYLGRITVDGLIPPVIKPISVKVKEFGSVAFIYSICNKIISSIITKHPKRYVKILPLAIIKFLYNQNIALYNNSYLSILFPNIVIQEETITIQNEIDRIANMFNHTISRTLKGDSLESVLSTLSKLYIVKVDNRWVVAEADQDVMTLINKYSIILEVNYG